MRTPIDRHAPTANKPIRHFVLSYAGGAAGAGATEDERSSWGFAAVALAHAGECTAGLPLWLLPVLPASDRTVGVMVRATLLSPCLAWMGALPPLEGAARVPARLPPSSPARCSHPSLPHYNPLFKSQFSAPRLDMPLPHCTLPHCILPHSAGIAIPLLFQPREAARFLLGECPPIYWLDRTGHTNDGLLRKLQRREAARLPLRECARERPMNIASRLGVDLRDRVCIGDPPQFCSSAHDRHRSVCPPCLSASAGGTAMPTNVEHDRLMGLLAAGLLSGATTAWALKVGCCLSSAHSFLQPRVSS